MVSNPTRYQRNPDFISRKVVDEFVLVPIRPKVVDMESIYTLNAVGATVWERLESPATLDELQAALLEEYEAAPEIIQADLQRFLQEMAAIGAIGEA